MIHLVRWWILHGLRKRYFNNVCVKDRERRQDKRSIACSTPTQFVTHPCTWEWASAYVWKTFLRTTEIRFSNVDGESTKRMSCVGLGYIDSWGEQNSFWIFFLNIILKWNWRDLVYWRLVKTSSRSSDWRGKKGSLWLIHIYVMSRIKNKNRCTDQSKRRSKHSWLPSSSPPEKYGVKRDIFTCDIGNSVTQSTSTPTFEWTAQKSGDYNWSTSLSWSLAQSFSWLS